MKKIDEIVIILQQYKERYGNCLVPYSYTTEDGFHLGWIVRHIRNGSRKINAYQKAKLNSLGFVWRVKSSPLPFEEVFKHLQEYKEKYGDCLVPVSYTTECGVRLGSIVNTIRAGSRKTSAKEKDMLNSIGFVWKERIHQYSMQVVIKLLKEYKEEYGDCLVPSRYITKDGIRLGWLVRNIRSGARNISAEEKEILDSMGFSWKRRESTVPFKEVMKHLQEYKELYGNCDIPASYITKNGIHLGWIVQNMRSGNRKTSANEKAKLNSLGFVWKKRKSPLPFDGVVKHLKEYKEQYGNCLVPYSYTTEDGIRLGLIVRHIRRGARKINEDEKEFLNSLGFVWKAKVVTS